MFKNSKKDEYIRQVENMCNEQSKVIRKLSNDVDDYDRLMNTLRNKLKGTKSVVVAIANDKNGNLSFVCMKDYRKPDTDYEQSLFLSGDVDLFVISPAIYVSNDMLINNLPKLSAKFTKTGIEIIDIYCKPYEERGYGTMLIENLIELGRKERCKGIFGTLAHRDGKEEEQRNKRNGFYEKRGFKLTYDDVSTKISGSVYYDLTK